MDGDSWSPGLLRCWKHLSSHSLLIVLPYLPLCFDPTDACFLDLALPVSTALALTFLAGDVLSPHTEVWTLAP